LVIVPSSAIQRGPQGTYVYVVQNGNTAKIEPVTIAQTTADSVGLSAGLNPGDLVVVDGQDKLQDGSKVNPTQASNTQNAAGAPPSAQQSNTQSGANTKRRPQAPQPDRSTGKR